MHNFYKLLNAFSDKSLDYKKCKFCKNHLYLSFKINDIIYKPLFDDKFINLFYYDYNIGDVNILINLKTNKIVLGPNLFNIKLSIHCTGFNNGCGFLDLIGETKNNHVKLNNIYSYKFNYRNICLKSIKHKKLSIVIFDNSRIENFDFFVEFDKRKDFIDNLIFI